MSPLTHGKSKFDKYIIFEMILLKQKKGKKTATIAWGQQA